MKQTLILRSAVMVLSVAGLAVTLAYASLLAGIIQSDDMVRYPTAETLSPSNLHLVTLVRGDLIQYSAFQTSDDPSRVLRWYLGHNGLSQNELGDALGNCMRLTSVKDWLFLQQDLAVTICSQSRATLIFVSRSLVLRR